MSVSTPNFWTRFLCQLAVHMTSRKLWLVLLALYAENKHYYAILSMVYGLPPDAQGTAFVTVTVAHYGIVSASILGYLYANAAIKKVEV